MSLKCKGCGHDRYDGGSHECPELKRTVYQYDDGCFVDPPPVVVVPEVVEEVAPEVVPEVVAEVPSEV